MAVRNLAWYALNASRAYPLDESATLTTDAGGLLPNDVLVDCRLLFPESLAKYAYLGAMTVSAKAVTLIFMGTAAPLRSGGCDAAPAAGTPVPLAAISLPKTGLVVHRHYPVQPLADGVGGWVVFGSGVTNKREGDVRYVAARFTSPSQTLLAPRAARSYAALPVTSASQATESTKLDGLVKLKAGSDIEISAESLTIAGRVRNAIVFRLKSTSPVGSGRNVFQIFSGDCLPRPESGNCDAEPIEQINSVSPDCCGRLSLNFLGCARLTPTADGHGVVIDCGVGMSDVCAGPDSLPAADGTLPNERTGECP